MKSKQKAILMIIIVFFSLMIFAQAEQGIPKSKGGELKAKRQPPTFFGLLFGPKYIAMLVIAFVTLLLLLAKKMTTGLKISLLLVSTLLFGLIQNLPGKFFSSFAMHPSPMCAATKSLLYGFRIPMIVSLLVIFLLTLIGPKLFCSYICPVGTLQELCSMAGKKLKIKIIKFNFSKAYAIRLALFIVFIFISATAILYVINAKGVKFPRSMYDYINPFHGFELHLEKTLLDSLIHFVPFILTVVLAFKIYRPFCHYVCPLGIYAHFLEQMALFRISFKKDSCTDCQSCVNESPCAAVPDILKEATMRPDCYACNDCIESCPEDALRVGIKKTESKAQLS